MLAIAAIAAGTAAGFVAGGWYVDRSVDANLAAAKSELGWLGAAAGVIVGPGAREKYKPAGQAAGAVLGGTAVLAFQRSSWWLLVGGIAVAAMTFGIVAEKDPLAVLKQFGGA